MVTRNVRVNYGDGTGASLSGNPGYQEGLPLMTDNSTVLNILNPTGGADLHTCSGGSALRNVQLKFN